MSDLQPQEKTDSPLASRTERAGLGRALESKEIERRSADDYRRHIQSYYDGFPGAFTLISGFFTGHEALAGRLISPRGFDIRGCKRILDAGCGNGRYLRFLLRQADADAELTGCDLSEGMLNRARRRLKSDRPNLLAADLTRLPYRDHSFDAIVCGWVLEHLPDPLPGLRELARVLRPGGKLLLLTTERTITGAICSRFYHCRTYSREELRAACAQCGLEWQREHWWSGLHRVFRLGGIVVELRRNQRLEG
jgi:ubiquinone/menaquinone biosynthesis C-methylase UbiE